MKNWLANHGCSGQRLRRSRKRVRFASQVAGLAVAISPSPPLPLSQTLGRHVVWNQSV